MAIETEQENGVAEVTISNPDVKNAINFGMMGELRDTLSDYATDDSVRCVLLQGDPEGEAFCTGADVRELMMYAGQGNPPELAERIDNVLHGIVRNIVNIKKPVVAKVDGPAVGAGCNIAIACDFVYASERSSFGEVFVNIGVSQDTGSSYLLPKLVGLRKAKELVMTGKKIDGEEAAKIGLINESVSQDHLDRVVESSVDDLATGATKAIGASKSLLHFGSTHTLDETLEKEAWMQSTVFESEDMDEGVTAFVQGRKPEFEGK
ncbi:MAG: enoyl-CoA hydratase/isomerase family protein [Halobacteria archaeon]